MLSLSMVLLGATSLSMQIVLLRELFTIFSGNELTIGIVMSLWMVLVGAGAAVSGRIISKIKSLTKSPAKSLADIFGIYRTIILVISVFLPAVIFLTKIIRPLLQGTPFETLGMTHTMFFSLCLLSPMCILLGSWFSAGTFTGVSAGRVYFLEAVGAILGGLITSFLLIKHFSSMQIAAGFSIVNFLLLIPLSVSRITVIPPMPPDGTPAQHTPLPRGIHLRKFVNPQAVVSIFFLFLFSIILFSGEIVKIDGLAGEIQWKPFTLVESKNSLYGNIVVLGPPQGRHAKGEKHLRGQHSGARHDLSDGHYDFYENGGKLFSTQERQQPEEIVHFAMFLCPNSQKVLLIGGGLSGNLYEVLKHPLRKVMLVELDPMLVSMAKKYLPPEDITALSDSRVEIFFGDGRYFTKTAVRRAEKYDCVIVDMPDPTTGLVSRFYTEEFFREIKSLLSDDGVFITGLSSADGYMSPEMRYLSAGLYKTIKKVFGGCSLVPGVKNYFISGNISGVPAPALADLLVSQKFHLTYLTPFYVRYVLGETRVQTLSDQVTEREEEVSLSRDFQPVNYFYGIMLQASYSGRSFVSRMEWLMKNRRTLLAGAFAGAVIVIISLWFQIRRRQKVGLQAERLRAGITLLAVACTGFCSLLLELVLIFAFQVKFGYVYHQIGILLTASMAGLAAGSYFSTRFIDGTATKNNYSRPFTLIQVVTASAGIFSLLLPLIIKSDMPAVLYPFLTFISGMPAGLLFPVATGIMGRPENSKTGSRAGVVYGFDLLGAAGGAFTSSVFLIPVLGLAGSSILAGVFFLLICLPMAVIGGRILEQHSTKSIAL